MFATGPWFAEQGRDAFYPEVVLTFVVQEPAEHHHVPLLLSPFAYSTYRGELSPTTRRRSTCNSARMAIVSDRTSTEGGGPRRRGRPQHPAAHLVDLNVSSSLRGDFAAAHTAGDNATS